MTHVTCRLTAKNQDQSGTLRSVIDYGLPNKHMSEGMETRDSAGNAAEANSSIFTLIQMR